jgi:hypothetical protein
VLVRRELNPPSLGILPHGRRKIRLSGTFTSLEGMEHLTLMCPFTHKAQTRLTVPYGRWNLLLNCAAYIDRMVLRTYGRGRPLNAPAAFIHPCQPIVAKQPPSGPGWAHELKHDAATGSRSTSAMAGYGSTRSTEPTGQSATRGLSRVGLAWLQIVCRGEVE